jgi:hypothetical protein
MSVRSRAPWRPSLLEACRSLSTSSGIRYSRLRLEALVWRAGGRESQGSLQIAALRPSYCAGERPLSHLGALGQVKVKVHFSGERPYLSIELSHDRFFMGRSVMNYAAFPRRQIGYQ